MHMYSGIAVEIGSKSVNITLNIFAVCKCEVGTPKLELHGSYG